MVVSGICACADFQTQALGTWKSPASGAVYPSGWRVRVPSEGLDVTITPLLRDQELIDQQLHVAYWEGDCDLSGTDRFAPGARRRVRRANGLCGRPELLRKVTHFVEFLETKMAFSQRQLSIFTPRSLRDALGLSFTHREQVRWLIGTSGLLASSYTHVPREAQILDVRQLDEFRACRRSVTKTSFGSAHLPPRRRCADIQCSRRRFSRPQAPPCIWRFRKRTSKSSRSGGRVSRRSTRLSSHRTKLRFRSSSNQFRRHLRAAPPDDSRRSRRRTT